MRKANEKSTWKEKFGQVDLNSESLVSRREVDLKIASRREVALRFVKYVTDFLRLSIADL